MSCVAMSLASYNEEISGTLVNPGNLNNWLNNHNGYANSDLIVWSAVNSLGKVQFKEEEKSLSTSTIANFVKNCDPVIANVRSGTHWVLITGATSNPDVWEVNDPYFSDTTYNYSGMVEFVVYDVKSSTFTSYRPLRSHEHQAQEALVADAQMF